MKFSIHKTSRYVIGALLTNLLSFLIYCILQFIFDPAWPVISLVVASFCVLPISYLFNRALVFESKNSLGREFAKFFGVYIAAIAFASVSLIGVSQIILNPYLAQFVSITFIGLVTLLTHSNWTFVKSQD
jgi:putative flippase GtrA